LVGLDEDTGVKLVVKKIYLMHTAFEPVEGGKDIHIPHSKLSSDCIQNWSRLAQKTKGGDPISVVLRFDPRMQPPSDIDMKDIQSKVEVIQLLVNDHVLKHPSHFYESPELSLVPIKDEDLFESGIQVEFRVKRKVRQIILRLIHLVAKLRRTLGISIKATKNSETNYCSMSVVYCGIMGSMGSYPKKASLLL
jgi:hypothetical protein